ncbi:hypothetical protein T265_01792 [Opisthorchis viverrini]|uniref:Uncharacterized protein n=1 Tax=Opisthorchis viverrini TaxID=6198 RepID=A0A075A8F4_OPIVI|nr:hypothetical protein T265_01792 [Opisthorchis viverrini]KER32005.1 hypothetical protein T265_01792 [Opisthorchis viverrini]
MTSIHTDRPPQPFVDHNRCGRNGCPSNVKRSMQCHACKSWWHFKCTGERQPLTDKNKTDPGNLGKSLDPVYQSVNP